MYEDLKTRILQTLEEWKLLIGFDLLDINVRWSESTNDEDADTRAATSTSWQYRDGNITFYLPTLVEYSDLDLEKLIAHELVHCVVSPMENHVKSKFEEQCEFAVENMARALCHLRTFIPKTGVKKNP